jgi:hypothetical protein
MNVLAESVSVKRDAELVIVGAGAHARKLWHYAIALGETVCAFVDDNPQAVSPSPNVPCMSVQEARQFGHGQRFVVAIGNAIVRKRMLKSFEEKGWVVVTLIHPSAYVAPDAHIEVGTVVCAHAIVETGAYIGIGSIVDVGAIVDHGSIVGAYNHIRPGSVLQPDTRIGDQ